MVVNQVVPDRGENATPSGVVGALNMFDKPWRMWTPVSETWSGVFRMVVHLDHGVDHPSSRLSLSRLNHWLPRSQAHPEVVQGTTEFESREMLGVTAKLQ
jgi:hypothetical protein